MTRDHDQLVDARLSQHSEVPLDEGFAFDLNQAFGPTAQAAARTGGQHNAAKAQPVSATLLGLTAGLFGHTQCLFCDHTQGNERRRETAPCPRTDNALLTSPSVSHQTARLSDP